jgi:hypothetical protein
MNPTRSTTADKSDYLTIRGPGDDLCYVQTGTDIEQVLKAKKPFILHCRPSDLKAMQGRSPGWNRFAASAWIIWG